METWALFMFCFVSSCSVTGDKCLLTVVCAPLSTFCFCLSWLFVVSSVLLLRWGDLAVSPAVTKGGDDSLQNAVTKRKILFQYRATMSSSQCHS